MQTAKEICFIIGMGRSGTTLLSKLLNRHPEIHCTPEAVFLIFFLHTWRNKKRFSKEDIDLVFDQIKWFSYTHPWAGWNFDVEKTKKQTQDFVKDNIVTYPELCKFICSHFEVIGQDKSKAKVIVDKNPSYTLFTDKISETFTNSKFIYIVRDYRANMLSRKENVDLRSPEVRHNAWLWNFFNSRALHFMRENRHKVLLVKYEDLVTDTEKQMKAIFGFLGLDPVTDTANTQYAEVKEAEHSIPAGHEARFKKKYDDLNRPVNVDRIDAWKTGLTEEEITACNSICGDLGKEFGYLPGLKTKPASTYMSFYLKAKKEVMKERFIYSLGPETKLKRLKKVYTTLGYNKGK